jgi:uncharacterized protein
MRYDDTPLLSFIAFMSMNLQALYEQTQYTQFLRSRYFVEGVITGACASPEIPLPDTWLPWTIGSRPQSSQQAQSAEDTEHIFEQLFAYFKHTLANMKDDELCLPTYATFKDVAHSKPLAEYCSGLMLAHQSLENLWGDAWQHMQDAEPGIAPALAKDLKHCLLVFSTFADPDAAVAQANARADTELLDKLPIIAQSLESTLRQYVGISGKLAEYLPNQFETFKQ